MRLPHGSTPGGHAGSGDGRRGGGVVFLNWRDTGNPEGGGSEFYVERIAAGLAARGRPVTMVCAAWPGAPREEHRDGIRIIRRGSRLTVYLWAFLLYLGGRLGPHEVVVDVQNGLPFFSILYARRPVVVLCHHVHREQWQVLFPAPLARLGWWIESRLAPFVYRRCRYVTVSGSTRRELIALGVRRRRSASSATAPRCRPVPTSAPGRRSRRSASLAGWCPTSGSSWPSRPPPTSA
jgi:hypothetical protein